MFIEKLKPKDFIALFTIAVIFIYKLTGHNGSFDTVVALIIGYYFGHRKSNIDKGN